ncbi:MAG: hypothetical protein HC875_26525 [Anaerolineales bacterium]|nr:hypothetical protein [Anaerolineales bacterium]
MTTEVQSIYTDHRQAREIQAVWLKDINELRAKHSKALSLLAQVEALIHEYDAELHGDGAAICLHELQIQRHELEWPAYKDTPGDPEYNELVAIHGQLKEEIEMGHQGSEHYRQLSAQYATKMHPLLESIRSLI